MTTAVLAGFGHAIAEVGAVLIVGGNINGLTRVMTTTIALETSKGNLELALALVTRPQVVLLDEPSASLDPASTKEPEASVRAVSNSGVKVLTATHDLMQARRLADDVLVFGEGKLLA